VIPSALPQTLVEGTTNTRAAVPIRAAASYSLPIDLPSIPGKLEAWDESEHHDRSAESDKAFWWCRRARERSENLEARSRRDGQIS